MAEFENNYFDFDTADNFLDSISGTLSNLLPSSVSGDEGVKEGMNVMDVMWEGELNNGLIKEEYGNPNWKDIDRPAGQAPQEIVFNEQNFGADQFYKAGPADGHSTTMSTTSYSQDSHSNEISPHQPSISSVHTSPEPIKSEKMESPVIASKKSKITKPKAKEKTSHNVIEKKYRTNINSKILMLRDAVPSLRIAAGSKDVSLADLEGLTPASKLNKASVLTKATEYIKHLESKNELLRQQNIQLQKLLQEADSKPVQYTPQNQVPAVTGRNVGHGFGYYPPEQSYNATPVQQSYSGSSQIYQPQHPAPALQEQYYQQTPPQNQYNPSNKVLLGGMATVMATSLFSGGASGSNDFKGMSALPFIPSVLTHPSPLLVQLWSTFKILLILGSVFSIVFSSLKLDVKSEKTKLLGSYGLLKTWFMVTMGFQLPLVLESSEKLNILRTLDGRKTSFVWFQILKEYLLLTASEITFENSFLTILSGKLLINRFPLLSKFLTRDLSYRASLIMNLEYKGDDESLKKLNKLMDNIDGLAMFGSQNLMSRLSNLVQGKKINEGLVDGNNHLKYVELAGAVTSGFNVDSEKTVLYDIIINWRILEIIHQLNLNYLANLAKDSDCSQVERDINKVEACLLDSFKSSSIYGYFKMFRAVVDPKNSPQLLQDLYGEVNEKLKTFNDEAEEKEELIEEQTETTSKEEKENNENVNVPTPSLKAQKSLITSLNLVNDEKFIIATTSLALYYHNNKEIDHAIKILRYLNLSTPSSLSLLSFTSAVRLINGLIPGVEDNKNLDNLVKVTREWLNESQQSRTVDFDVRSDLSKLIVQKGMVLHGIETEHEDD
ncbi:uncharacterized protein CANTADRAFT_51014 [Suhomyces tanzawaensis NRRL Y-17324]|uniref:BHLH domain-containing protein n=1 Tax=Suhomyces tanzawaensis NRRL Y-17324 TaxID=984487 RepID=A0A1E4SH98_9ASCO|nr:uncharacterized protein CANTADRAFT_51014 [Suhomyces tanzawaensis NRRL Y-17324]ODV78884.1 hypothetical protein CANTADRAFT_51014 [Suhomyces tanzawaensis NRRL Y-17324]